jgi:hypothetical protein
LLQRSRPDLPALLLYELPRESGDQEEKPAAVSCTAFTIANHDLKGSAMPKRPQHSPGDNTGRPDAIGPHGINPPSRGRASGGDAGAEPQVNFDDDEIASTGGSNARRGGTWKATGGDSGELGPPSEQLSDRNEPREKHPRGGS